MSFFRCALFFAPRKQSRRGSQVEYGRQSVGLQRPVRRRREISLSTQPPSTGDVKIIFLLISFADKGFDEDAMSVQQTKQAVVSAEKTAQTPLIPLKARRLITAAQASARWVLTATCFILSQKRFLLPRKQRLGIQQAHRRSIRRSRRHRRLFSGYDSDGDGLIDGLVLSLPAFDDIATQNGVCIPPATYTTSYILPPGGNLPSWDGVRPQTYLINFAQPSNTDEGRRSLNQSVCHLLGHSLGLPDYCNASGADDSEGLKGDAGHELMDDMTGDLSAFFQADSRLAPPPRRCAYSTPLPPEAQNFSLSPMNEPGGSCLVIYNNALQNSYLSEYLICEYITPTRNNKGRL